MKINSAYLCVRDMDRAIDFYEKFLDQPVKVRDKVFSIFDFKGFRLCLFAPDEVKEEVSYGDNCLLSFEVDDMNKLIEKLKNLNAKITYPLTKIGNNQVLEFRDTEGNDVEVYCKLTI
jgi:predicted enzyme related to lactoylglutathione lyase